MKTKALRLYGASDLRTEEFELPEISDEEILVKVITDTLCMSTYKIATQGEAHKRVPAGVHENPVILGHEFAGIIEQVGAKWKDSYRVGQHITLQPNINYLGKGYGPGCSFTTCGGDATYTILHPAVMEADCLLDYQGDAFYKASLAEPLSCIIAGLKSFYHSEPSTPYIHEMGIKDGGNMAVLAACGPMGIGAIDLILHGEKKPKLLAITDINKNRFEYAKKIFNDKVAEETGVEICFINPDEVADAAAELMKLTNGEGYDDVLVMTPADEVIETATKIFRQNGCFNFFAGPPEKSFSSKINFYDIHYKGVHLCGTAGGNTQDMQEALRLIAEDKINPSCMITHIVGLDHVAQATLDLPKTMGGKNLLYPGLNLPLTKISDFGELGKTNPHFAKLDEICRQHNGMWNPEAEKYLLENMCE